MKKFLVTILAIIYLAASAGATVHLHYCMGKLVDSSLVQNENRTCGNCGMEKSGSTDNDCCKDEATQVGIAKDQKGTDAFPDLLKLSLTEIPVLSPDLPVIHPIRLPEKTFFSKAPPRCSGLETCIFHCSLLI